MKANHVKPKEISPEEMIFNEEYKKLGMEHDAVMEEQIAAMLRGDREKGEELLLKAEAILDKIQQLEKSRKNMDELMTPAITKELEELKRLSNKKLMN
jgi:hypothetical protein